MIGFGELGRPSSLRDFQALIASKVELKLDEPVKAASKSAKDKDKSAKVDAKTATVEAKDRTAKGVHIAAIVEVINAKVDAKLADQVQNIDPKAKPAMPAKKITAKAKP